MSYSIKVRLDPRKAEYWVRIMQDILSEGLMSSETAQKLAGRLGFVAYAVLGPLGASHVNHLYRRCHEDPPVLSIPLKEEVLWWCNCLSRNNRVTIPLPLESASPIIIYIDADGKGGTGGVLSTKERVLWFRSHVESFFRNKSVSLHKRKTQIIPYEAIAVYQAVRTFRRDLIGRDVVLFIDNASVLGSIRKGRCRSQDVHGIISLILSELESAHVRVHACWVPSSLNVADVPSRGHALQWGSEVQCE